MHWFFAPAFQLLGRMAYSRKFMLTGGLLLLPMLYLLASTLSPLVLSVELSTRMSRGAGTVQALQPLVLAIQRHRGLTNSLLAGNAGARVAVGQAAQQAEAAFRELRALMAAEGDPFHIEGRMNALQGEWGRLANAAASMQREDSFAAHSRLIGDILELIGAVADGAGLTLDAEPDTYFLQDALTAHMLPLIESLGQARGLTTGVLAKGAISDAEKIDISLHMGRIQVHAEKTVEDLKKALAARPELASDLERHMVAVADGTQAFLGLTAINSIRERFTMDSPAYFHEATAAVDKTVDLSQAATAALTRLLEQRRARSLNRALLTGAGALAALALALYLAVAMEKAITRDVRRIEQAASALAAGDLTQGVAIAARDEVGRIAQAFEQARLAIAGLVHNATGAAGQVASMAAAVAENAGCCAGAANRQSESVSASAAAVEQMAVSSAHIADQTREANAIGREAGELLVRGQAAIDAANREMHTVAGGVRQAADQIAGLNVRADEISGIVQVIREIADQTNLLALNAAIEAARAGELGRGFAVVADEVRKLAERTAKATTEIADMIGSVQSESAGAVARMEVSQQQALDGVATVENATRALDDIRRAVAGVLERVTEIAGASAEQKVASTDIARNVEQIAQMTESNSATAAQVSSQAGQMGELVDGLTAELRRFRTRPAGGEGGRAAPRPQAGVLTVRPA